MTGGFELTHCRPNSLTRSIIHAACIDMQEGAGRSTWLIDDEFIISLMTDMQRYFTSLREIKNHLQRALSTDRVMSTSSCTIKEVEEEYFPGRCRRQSDYHKVIDSAEK